MNDKIYILHIFNYQVPLTPHKFYFLDLKTLEKYKENYMTSHKLTKTKVAENYYNYSDSNNNRHDFSTETVKITQL